MTASFVEGDAAERVGELVGVRQKADIKFLDSGNGVFVFQADGLIYRVARTDWVAKRLMREADLLRHLKNAGHDTPIPVIEKVGTNPAFFSYRPLPGKRLDRVSQKTISRQERLDLAMSVARFMAELHSSSIPENADSYLEELFISRSLGSYPDILQQWPDGIDPDLRRNAAAAAAECQESCGALSGNDKSVMLHMDIGGSNILVDKDRHRLTGVIDFTTATVGNYHWDFRYIRRTFRGDAFRCLIETYEAARNLAVSIDDVGLAEKVSHLHSLRLALDRGDEKRIHKSAKMLEHACVR